MVGPTTFIAQLRLEPHVQNLAFGDSKPAASEITRPGPPKATSQDPPL